MSYAAVFLNIFLRQLRKFQNAEKQRVRQHNERKGAVS